MRVHIHLLVSICLFHVLAVAQMIPPDHIQQSFPSPSTSKSLVQQRRVTVLMSATDRNGNPLAEFTKQQVAVSDNGQPGEILDLRSADSIPLDLAIVLLASRGDFKQQQAAAIDLATKVLRPNTDHAFVLVAGGNKAWPNSRIEWLADTTSVEKVIKHLDPDSGMPDAFAFDFSSDNAGMNRRLNVQHYTGGGSSVFNILWQMMETDPRPVRRAVAIFRNAWAHSSGAGDRIGQVVDSEHSTVIRDAQRLWVPFYILAVPEPTAVPTSLSKTYSPIQTGEGGYNRVYDQEIEKFRERARSSGEVNLEKIAIGTGGRVWLSSGKKNYSDVVNEIATLIKSSYALTYSVPVTPGGGPEHTLELHVKDSSVHVRFQKAYLSRQPTSPANNDPAAATAEPQTGPQTAPAKPN